MTKRSGPTHVVVDGSNIATEGRSLPSLSQLNDAVLAFMAEFPDTTVTVVVDATFGHRIEKSEQAEFDLAVSNNELVAPPAGAVGRGDAFVLGIANKAGATVLSNDSFQEFHGDYDWLFDEGRLVGGKPVPHVGWVFVPRVPVRGPISRRAVRDGKGGSNGGGGRERRPAKAASESRSRSSRRTSKEASQPMPIPSAPPPRPAGEKRASDKASQAGASAAGTPAGRKDVVNELMPFLEFVERHPVGTSVNGTVESYSSHGAYVTIGDVRGYVPLRLMGDPPPRSAREAMKVGDAVTLVVADYAPARRSIDCAVPGVVPKTPGQSTDEVVTIATEAAAVEAVAAKQAAPSRRTAAKKAAPAKKAAAKKSPAKKAASAKRAAGDMPGAPPTESAAEVPATEQPEAAKPSPTAKKAAPTKRPAAAGTAPAKKAPAKKAPAKKVPAKQAAATRTPAKKAATKKAAPATKAAPSTKAAAKKAPAKKAPAKKATAAAESAPARKAAAKKAATKQSATKKAAAKKSAGRGGRASSEDQRQ